MIRAAKGRKAKNQRKDVEIRVRVTADQKRILIQAAEKAGLDLSPWLRSIAVQQAERVLQGR